MRVAALAALVVLGSAGCDAVFGLERDDSKPWLDGYAFRKRITITPNVATDLVDVPISVATAVAPELMSGARADGTDLVFTADDDDTILDYEIVDYDSATGALDAWVRIPALRGQAATELSLYYGGPIRAAVASATWPSRCALVWHLSGTTTTEHDSTTNAHHPSGVLAPPRVAGIAGYARDLAPASRLAIPSVGLDFATVSFGFSIWVRIAQTLGSYDSPFYRGGSSATNEGYSLLLGTSDWQAELSNGTGTNLVISVAPQPVIDRWTQLAVIVDREALAFRGYRDGVEVASVPLAPTFGSIGGPGRELELGSLSYPFQGTIDEVRMYSGAPPPAWFTVEFANLTDRARFMQIGAEEAR